MIFLSGKWRYFTEQKEIFFSNSILWLKRKKQLNKKFFFQQILLIFAVLRKNISAENKLGFLP